MDQALGRAQFSVATALDGPSSGNFIAIGALDGDGRTTS